MIARETRRIRVGSGGILLPNYAPLKVAENFGTLEALSPGRINIGIGRAPNQDKRTALALRRSEAALTAADDWPIAGRTGGFCRSRPSASRRRSAREVIASPEGVPFPPIWLLGSGQLSGKLAAEHGRGFAAAYHFSPIEAEKAIRPTRRTSSHQPICHTRMPSSASASSAPKRMSWPKG